MSSTRYCQVVLIFFAGLLASSAANLLNHLLAALAGAGLLTVVSIIGDSLTALALLAAVFLYIRVVRGG